MSASARPPSSRQAWIERIGKRFGRVLVADQALFLDVGDHTAVDDQGSGRIDTVEIAEQYSRRLRGTGHQTSRSSRISSNAIQP